MGNTRTIACLFFVMAFIGATMAAEYEVGDAEGWKTGVDYQKWASKYNFKRGDTLRFVWNGDYNVIIVTKKQYKKCQCGLLNVFKVNNSEKFWLLKSGDYYFISDVPNDACKNGMKLHIKVSSGPWTDALPPNMPRITSDGVALSSLSTFIIISCLVGFLALAY